jgi:hypothetical protein
MTIHARSIPPHSSDDETRNPMQERDKVDQAELDRYGIERIPADVFLWGGYRYSSARDAVAAARRNAK